MDLTGKMNGIIGVINTPFTPEDTVDTASLRRYVNHSLSCNVTGFLTTAMAAEVNKLTMEERIMITETVVQAVNGKVPVIGGASAATTGEMITLAQAYSAAGCDGILINIPFEDEKTYLKKTEQVARHIKGFMMIQDWDVEGYGLPVEVITRLFREIDIFGCLKVEVKPAGVKYTQVLEATQRRLHVSGGWAATQMIEALDRGVHAFMPTPLHDVYDRIYRLHHTGKRNKAILLFNRLLPVISFSHQHVDISIHFHKRLYHEWGIFSTPRVRDPILLFDAYHERVARELIDYARNLSREIKNGEWD